MEEGYTHAHTHTHTRTHRRKVRRLFKEGAGRRKSRKRPRVWQRTTSQARGEKATVFITLYIHPRTTIPRRTQRRRERRRARETESDRDRGRSVCAFVCECVRDVWGVSLIPTLLRFHSIPFPPALFFLPSRDMTESAITLRFFNLEPVNRGRDIPAHRMEKGEERDAHFFFVLRSPVRSPPLPSSLPHILHTDIVSGNSSAASASSPLCRRRKKERENEGGGSPLLVMMHRIRSIHALSPSPTHRLLQSLSLPPSPSLLHIRVTTHVLLLQRSPAPPL